MNLVSEVRELGETLLDLYSNEKNIPVDSMSALERQVQLKVLFTKD